jgi:SNF2 family DNA or RNA helicase
MILDPRLHAYQRRAVEHLHGTGEPGAGLFLDMGLGKTATVLQALTPEHLPALALGPKRVAEEVWKIEGQKWRPDLSVVQAVGSVQQRAKALNQLKYGADVIVMTRDTLNDIGKRKHPFKTVILDELSGYKNKGTNRWKVTRDVTRDVEHVWGMTGTPAPNGYMDLYAQVYLLDTGKRLGSTLTAYRDRYFNVLARHPQTNVVIKWGLKDGAEEAINALLEDLCISMKAEDYLELPDLTFNEVRVQMPPAARKAYTDLQETLVADLQVLGGPDAIHTAGNAAVLSSRLRQVTAGFLYDDVDTTRHTWLHDEKIKALQEIIDETGSPVLVFYYFKEEARRILDAVDGAVSINTPGAVKDWNDGKIKVLLAHPASAGHGLNLQHGGYTMVYTTLPWSLEEWEQSVHRLHRQGQQKAVLVHWLNAGPVDSAVFKRLKEKKTVQDALLDYLKEQHLWL